MRGGGKVRQGSEGCRLYWSLGRLSRFAGGTCGCATSHAHTYAFCTPFYISTASEELRDVVGSIVESEYAID